MSEAEIWQLMFMAVDSSLGCVAAILTMCFAYIAAAYFEGNKLSRTQALVITLIFVGGAGMMTVALFGTLSRYYQFNMLVRHLYPDERFVAGAYFVRVWTGLMVTIALASVFFMYQIRRNPQLAHRR
jgi:hypothetical protein